METKLNKGGKRLGAGRKPVSERKQQVSLYIQPKFFYKFGSEEKMKEKLYEFIDKFGEAITAVGQTNSYDAPPVHKNYFEDEPPKMDIPKISQYDAYKKEIKECRTIKEIQLVIEEVKKDLTKGIIFPKQNIELQELAKIVSKDFYTD